MDVDRAVERLQLLAFHQVHQLFPAQDAPGVLRQRDQEIELVAGQGRVMAIDLHGA